MDTQNFTIFSVNFKQNGTLIVFWSLRKDDK